MQVIWEALDQRSLFLLHCIMKLAIFQSSVSIYSNKYMQIYGFDQKSSNLWQQANAKSLTAWL